MKKQIKIFILILGVILILLLLKIPEQEISSKIDKKIYRLNEILKIKIENNSPQRQICFSSCRPYFLERKNGNWQSYPYGSCKKPNLNEYCIEPRKFKVFEIDLSFQKEGTHRIALPVCLGCKAGFPFKETKRFYSNQFIIKK